MTPRALLRPALPAILTASLAAPASTQFTNRDPKVEGFNHHV